MCNHRKLQSFIEVAYHSSKTMNPGVAVESTLHGNSSTQIANNNIVHDETRHDSGPHSHSTINISFGHSQRHDLLQLSTLPQSPQDSLERSFSKPIDSESLKKGTRKTIKPQLWIFLGLFITIVAAATIPSVIVAKSRSGQEPVSNIQSNVFKGDLQLILNSRSQLRVISSNLSPPFLQSSFHQVQRQKLQPHHKPHLHHKPHPHRKSHPHHKPQPTSSDPTVYSSPRHRHRIYLLALLLKLLEPVQVSQAPVETSPGDNLVLTMINAQPEMSATGLAQKQLAHAAIQLSRGVQALSVGLIQIV